jgi:hypothetical protein
VAGPDYAKYATFALFNTRAAHEADPEHVGPPNVIARKYETSEAPIRAVFKGNQGGGTAIHAHDVVHRLLGIHPVKKRNVLNKPIRMVSKVVPESDADEQNQQYVEMKRFLKPMGIIRKDITARSKMMTIKNQSGAGKDFQVEFMASTQELDAFMSVQRSAYYQDEEIDRIKFDESMIRLLREGGDCSISVTPAKGLDWMYDSIWRRAKKIYRSKWLNEHYGLPEVEESSIDSGIECFCWATDDNPVMTQEHIKRIFDGIDDPDELAMRRGGIFRQVSGRIYKVFDEKIHVQPYDKVFDPALFRTFWHYRIIDFHPQKPWYITFLAVSPEQEWFIWNEMVAKHDVITTFDLRERIKSESLLGEDEMFNRATLIDPLSTVKQGNTGYSTFDDLAQGEDGIRRLTPADTKNMEGEEIIKIRLKNSLICGVPGNNLNRQSNADSKYGAYLPTLWFLDNCKTHVEHFKSWRYVDYKMEHVKATRVVKRKSEKFSDMCRNVEFLACLNPIFYTPRLETYEPYYRFQGNRRAAYA